MREEEGLEFGLLGLFGRKFENFQVGQIFVGLEGLSKLEFSRSDLWLRFGLFGLLG